MIVLAQLQEFLPDQHNNSFADLDRGFDQVMQICTALIAWCRALHGDQKTSRLPKSNAERKALKFLDRKK